MSEQDARNAWLQLANGGQTDLVSSCHIGRTADNDLVLTDDRVSRRHALIHAQGPDEFWLVDLGSVNGTYLNGRRVTQPCKLNDRDNISIGLSHLSFHYPTQPRRAERKSTDTEKTIQDLRAAEGWLLVADIEGSTAFINKNPEQEAAVITGTWLETCHRLIDSNHGSITKFLGDGFMAFWMGGASQASPVAKTLAQLHLLQERNHPRFRMILHFGKVFLGGISLGEENIAGPEVTFASRMEKVAAKLKVSCLLSESANNMIAPHLPCDRIASSSVPSFNGSFEFFSPKFASRPKGIRPGG